MGREGQEEKNAVDQFGVIRANDAEFVAILQHLNLPDKADYTTAEKLSIYREHKKLTYAVQMRALDKGYSFTLRVGQGQGYRIEGNMTGAGDITVLSRETSFNTCPICLAEGTLIDTPYGPVPVEQLKNGMAVWTVNASGQRVVGNIISTMIAPVPAFFQVVRVVLNDGRSVMASPGHPSAVGRALGEYHVNDVLDGGVVVSTDRIDYDAGATYDILPSGDTGMYWANGILLKSTLTGN